MEKTLSNKKVANKIRKIREIKNLSREYMCTELGVSLKSYANWESGIVDLTINKINKISDILEVSTMDLLSFDEKLIFENCKNGIFGYINSNNTYNEVSEKERELYESLIQSLKKQIELLS